jgi:hypothetical protein
MAKSRHDDGEGAFHTMSPDGPVLVVDGWIGRAMALVKIANQITVTSVLLAVLVFIALVWIGKVNVPLYAKLDRLFQADTQTATRLGTIEASVKANHDDLVSLRILLVTFWRVECQNAAKSQAALRNCDNIK